MAIRRLYCDIKRFWKNIMDNDDFERRFAGLDKIAGLVNTFARLKLLPWNL